MEICPCGMFFWVALKMTCQRADMPLQLFYLQLFCKSSIQLPPPPHVVVQIQGNVHLLFPKSCFYCKCTSLQLYEFWQPQPPDSHKGSEQGRNLSHVIHVHPSTTLNLGSQILTHEMLTDDGNMRNTVSNVKFYPLYKRRAYSRLYMNL